MLMATLLLIHFCMYYDLVQMLLLKAVMHQKTALLLTYRLSSIIVGLDGWMDGWLACLMLPMRKKKCFAA